MSLSRTLDIFKECLSKVPAPRSSRGQSHVFRTVLALVFLGLIANCTTPTGIQQWADIHCSYLRRFFRIRKKGVPHATTFTRILKKLSLADLQNAFAEFVNALLASTEIVAAVDGKAAKQMTDENGEMILMLNVFAQQIKLHLASWEVHGDKTNEPGCLMKHLKELCEMYPCLKLLTGDAIFTQRPLLEAIREYGKDYLFQVKENQPKVLAKMEQVFADAPQREPDDRRNTKKKDKSKLVVCG
jgi:hypothetical protein